MKVLSFVLPVLIALPGLVQAQKGIVESSVPPAPIVVDGAVDEWPMEWMIEPKGKFIYNICNDAENLYIRIRISDDLTQRKVGLYGLTVFLNQSGKKIGKIGLKYPVEKDLDQLAREAPAGEVTAKQVIELKNSLIKDAEVLQLVGFSKEPIVSARLGLKNGLEVFIRPDARGDFIYEAKLPFKAFRIEKSKVKMLGVAFVTGKMPVKTPPPSNNSQTQAPGGYIPQGYDRTRMRQMYGYGMGSSAPQLNAWQTSTFMSVGVMLK